MLAPVPAARRLASLLLLAVLVWLLRPAVADAGRPIIPPGREAEIIALFQPHALGDELSPGWTLHSMDIERSTIIVWLEGPSREVYAKLVLDHPDYGPANATALPSFAWSVAQAPPGSEAAIERLRERIAANDDGRFWADDRGAVSETVTVEHTQARKLVAWLSDGLLLFACLLAVLTVLLVDKLRDAPSWQRAALLAIVAVGAVWRLTLPVRVAMAPWPYTRVLITAKLVYAGPLLGLLHPEPVYLVDVIHATTRVLSMLAPLAIYVHARYLLVDRRAALVAAAIVASLPLHLRFSASDAAFISSITISSVTFAMTHAAVRERRLGRVALMLLFLPVPLALTVLVRPLNILYLPLLIATAFVDEGLYEDKARPSRARAAIVVLVIAVVTLAVAVPFLRARHAHDVSAGLSIETLTAALAVLPSPRMNALINPSMTPTGLLLLAIYGGVELGRRRRWRLLAFLLAWLLGFLIAHGYVVPVEPLMQARYHLHLIVPFMCLSAAGIEAGLRRLDGLPPTRRHALVAALALYIGAAPLLHRHMIRDVAFNDMREWQFVHALRERVEPGCVVLEHTGMGTDSRAERMGAYMQAGIPRQRFPHVSLAADDAGTQLSDEALALLQQPPACLYLLQALPCFSAKPDHEPIAPVCREALGWLPHHEVARVGFDSRLYDENLAAHLGEVEWIELVLLRLESDQPELKRAPER